MTHARASPRLTDGNRAALVAVRARVDRSGQLRRIARLLAGTGVDGQALLRELGGQGLVTLNFHPDRLLGDGRSVARALAEDGVYRCQFETGISNGGLTAYPGGDRDRWEHALFAGAYHAVGVGAAQRPRYGGLNLMNYRNGACPRFGSCHLRLRPAVRERATFLYGDSAEQRVELGTVDALEPVLIPLLDSS